MTALGLALLGALAAATPVERWALVLGQNQALQADTPALHYADDDAVATHILLQQLGVRSILLVDLDADSRREHRGVVPAGPPTRQLLEQSVRRIFEEVRTANARGAHTELLFFYSGHGEVEHGEGFMALADGKLTRSELYAEVIDPSPAARNHVVIDACKSYYLAFAKGAAGERASFPAGFAASASPASARTGFVLSTSSERDSHEWERFQAGIFSHQVRSALRGAADVDGDGAITYVELSAFLQVANRRIENARFRPDYMVRPPRDAAGAVPFVAWSAASETVALGDRPWGHLFVENGIGERLLDVHARPEDDIRLHLPPDRPLFVRSADMSQEWALETPGSVALAELSPGPVSVSRRGAEHLAFERLFAAPFGRADLEAYLASSAAAAPVATAGAGAGPDWRAVGGFGALAAAGLAGVAGAGATLWALERYSSGAELPQQERIARNGQIEALNLGALGAYTVAGAAALGGGGLLAWWLVTED